MRWPEYIPVGKRLDNGRVQASQMLGNRKLLQPIHITGRKIAKTFWGASWCNHFETYSDYANRLPRGRTYARNGSVLHLEISPGSISALVAGSDLYRIAIQIDKLPAQAWKRLCRQCTSSVSSTLDLLRGRLPEPILSTLTDPRKGLFPRSREIRLACDCPDSATLCKHLAAVLYGVGSRLDESPELLFVLRAVDQNDLVASSLVEATSALSDATHDFTSGELEDIFGIEMVDGSESPENPSPIAASESTKKKAVKKKVVKRSAVRVEVAKKKVVKKKVVTRKVVTRSAVRMEVAKKKAAKRKAVKKKAVKKKAAKKKAAKKKAMTRKASK